jgi:predicted SnoaL-like aldol condensation-catalyzing enzyme
MIAVDIFRVADGKVIEHWDVMQEEVPASATASGNPMFTSAAAK